MHASVMPPKPSANQGVPASLFKRNLLAPSWGLPQILNFVTQTGTNTDQHAVLKSFVAGGQSWEAVRSALEVAPEALFNLSLAWSRWPALPESSLEQARTLARSVKVALGHGFTLASGALMAALMIAVQRYVRHPEQCGNNCKQTAPAPSCQLLLAFTC